MPKELANKNVKSAREKRRAQEKQKNIYVFGAIAIVIVIVAIFSLTRPHPEALSAARLKLDPTYGSETAKVTITEVSDFG